MKNEQLVKGYILVIISAFLFGCMPLITCNIYEEGINRESVVLMRSLLGLPVLAALTLWKSRSFAIPVKALPRIGICMFYNPNEPLDMTGCILALVSGVTYAVYIVLISGFKYKEISGFKFSFYISVVCSVLLW